MKFIIESSEPEQYTDIALAPTALFLNNGNIHLSQPL